MIFYACVLFALFLGISALGLCLQQVRVLSKGSAHVRSIVERGWLFMDAWVLGAPFFLLAIASMLVPVLGSGPAEPVMFEAVSLDLFLPVALHAIVGVVILVTAFRRRGGWQGAFGKVQLKQDAKQAVIFLFGLFVVLIAVNLGWERVLSSYALEPPDQPVVESLRSAQVPWGVKGILIFVAVAVAPFSEELLFRGVLLPGLLRVAHPVLAVAFAATCFAAVHVNVASLPSLLCLSVSLCFAYIATKRLSVCIMIHALFNAASCALIMAGIDP